MKEVLADGDEVSVSAQDLEDLAEIPEEMDEFEEAADFPGDAEDAIAETASPEASGTEESVPVEESEAEQQEPSITDTIIAPLLEETA